MVTFCLRAAGVKVAFNLVVGMK